MPAPGKEATLYTVMSVSENDVALYGFATEDQRACFKMLTGVSGVGPKAALSILSARKNHVVSRSFEATWFFIFIY